MDFSIVTPSFRSSAWLKLCIASVADQEGITLEHIVQDARSDDGTQDWLPYDPRVRAFIEKDEGMYDAVNKGFARANGAILAYLNCDEQYLPGALKTVLELFRRHPDVDVLLTGTIVVDEDGEYICHRAPLRPHPHHMWYRFPLFTSSMFVRRHVIQDAGYIFDTRWRDLGDYHWFRTLMENGLCIAGRNVWTSAFADTGDNMNLKPNAVREKAETLAMAPRWVRMLKYVWIAHHRLRRLFAGHFTLPASHYSIYTLRQPDRRVRFDVHKPTGVWRNRL
jgi:glycosyltransferase involved in cell wall biosynthesis